MALQTKAIKQRIKSVKSTRKVTKAMELVAASKMRRAVSKTLDARPYAKYTLNILRSLKSKNEEHQLFQHKTEGKTLVVLISSNRGLCGAFNAQIIRATVAMLKEQTGETFEFVTVGKKGDAALRRIGLQILAAFEGKESVDIQTVIALNNLIMERFGTDEYKRVLVAYTDYVSVLVQKPRIRQLLPLGGIETDADLQNELNGNGEEYLFEPNQEKVMGIIAEKIVRMQMYSMLLESNASEQSARMIAMKNATEAAGEMVDDLVLMFNKARQAGITQEISEISAGQASVK